LFFVLFCSSFFFVSEDFLVAIVFLEFFLQYLFLRLFFFFEYCSVVTLTDYKWPCPYTRSHQNENHTECRRTGEEGDGKNEAKKRKMTYKDKDTVANDTPDSNQTTEIQTQWGGVEKDYVRWLYEGYSSFFFVIFRGVLSSYGVAYVQ
jgi:hypothetical protein